MKLSVKRQNYSKPWFQLLCFIRYFIFKSQIYKYILKLNNIDEYFKGLNVQVRFQIFSDDVLVIQNKDCVINLNFCQAVKVKQLSNKNFFIFNKVY